MSGSKFVPGDGTAAERFAALFPLYPPRAHTDLRQASVTEATVATYIESLNRFKFFIAAWGIHGSFGELLEAPEAFESTLVFFVQWLYDNGHPRSHATALLSALAFFHPRLASTAQLASSHRQVKGWLQLFPTKHKIPMPKSISRLFATRFAQMGRLDCAICLLTGFDNYLRPGESVGARVEDIVYPTAAARSEAFRHGVWALPRTKTGENQSVTLRHDAGAILLPMLTEGKPKRAYLFPALEGQYHRWYHLLAQVAAYFGLQHFKWTPHTPRLGGSTEDFLRLLPILDILRRGRWASVKSLTSYVQQGQSLLAQNQLPQDLGPTLGRLMAMPEEAFARFLLSCRPPPPPLRFASSANPTGLPPRPPRAHSLVGARGRVQQLRR